MRAVLRLTGSHCLFARRVATRCQVATANIVLPLLSCVAARTGRHPWCVRGCQTAASLPGPQRAFGFFFKSHTHLPTLSCFSTPSPTFALALLYGPRRANGRLLLVPATCSCSLAFLFPVGTPPNAIAFASGRVSMRAMATAGAALTLAVFALLALAVSVTMPLVIGEAEAVRTPGWAAAACANS